MKRTVKYVIVSAIVLAVIFPPRADAYLDPGTGSYILQITAAVFFAGIFLLKAGWGHIKHFVSSIIHRKGAHSSEKSSKKSDK